MTKPAPFEYAKTSPVIIRWAVMLYVGFPPSFQNVEDLAHERGIDVGHEVVRYWWSRLGRVIKIFNGVLRGRAMCSIEEFVDHAPEPGRYL